MSDLFKRFLCWLLGHDIQRKAIYPYTLRCVRCKKRADELDIRTWLEKEADNWRGM